MKNRGSAIVTVSTAIMKNLKPGERGDSAPDDWNASIAIDPLPWRRGERSRENVAQSRRADGAEKDV
jgi:hypothetical protein